MIIQRKRQYSRPKDPTPPHPRALEVAQKLAAGRNVVVLPQPDGSVLLVNRRY